MHQHERNITFEKREEEILNMSRAKKESGILSTRQDNGKGIP
jgi:hypothetical protein